MKELIDCRHDKFLYLIDVVNHRVKLQYSSRLKINKEIYSLLIYQFKSVQHLYLSECTVHFNLVLREYKMLCIAGHSLLI